MRTGHPPEPFQQARPLIGLGQVALRAGRLPEARRCFKQAERLMLALPDGPEQVNVYTGLSAVYRAAGQPGRAEALARLAVAAGHTPTTPLPYAQALRELAQALADQGRHAPAYRLSQQAQAITDSILNQENTARLAEAQARYASSQQQGYIRELQQQNALRQQQVAEQRRGLAALLFVLALASGAGAALYRLYRHQRRLGWELARRGHQLQDQNTQLVTIQAALQQALDDQEIFLHEFNHRVKNNLQLIGSLLALQTQHPPTGTQTLVQLLRQSQSWVRAIAFSHELLAQMPSRAGNRVEQVDFPALTRQIADYLGRTYQHLAPGVRCTLHMPPLLLPAPMAVPIALILNELLTNSYKYAFGAAPGGHLTVWLEVAPDGRHHLRVQDSGPGLPPNFDPTRASSLGLRLVQQLARQLGGELQWSTAGQPTEFVLVFGPIIPQFGQFIL